MQITGTVKSAEDGLPVPGASVQAKGTTIGTATDTDGNYSLSVPQTATTLVFSFIGFKTQEIEIAGRSTISVDLESDMLALEEIVVTALGISREKKSLGYAVQDIKGDDLAQAKETNIVNSLSGKISGVQVTNSSGAVGSSSRIVIRGNSSFANNQPLWVVDGVPMSNASTAVSQWGAQDFGNAAMDIDPQNIENISVLKGANAAALYGSRGANGVILISTKTGKSDKKGLGVAYSFGFNVDQPYVFVNYQNLYGQGAGGDEYYYMISGAKASGYSYQDFADGTYSSGYGFSYYNGFGGGVYDNYDESWGPRLDIGLNMPQFDSPLTDPNDPSTRQATPWVSQPDNIKDFFQLGLTYDNSFTLSSNHDKGSARLSLSSQSTRGTIPNTDLTKYTVSLNATQELSSRLTANTSFTYVKNFSDNLPGQGYDPNNVMQSLGGWFGRQVNMQSLKDNWETFNVFGNPYNWNTNYHNNPYWTTGYNTTQRDRNRVFGNVNLSYKLTDWLSIMGRVGTDWYQESRKHVERNMSLDYPNGYFWQNFRYDNEFNADLFLNFNQDIDDISINGIVGGNFRQKTYSFMQHIADELTVPNLFTIGNVSGNPRATMYDEKLESNSVFAQTSLGWKRMIYLDLTARNDWSSTLPADSWSYFYPSATVSVILSELLESMNSKPDFFSFAKIRGGWAMVGNDTDPYKLNATFLANTPFSGISQFYTNRTLPPVGLMPEKTTSFEVGLDVMFFKNRFGFDFTYYDMITTNQILAVQVSNATGYNSMLINAGEIQNKGVEIQLTGKILENKDGLNWDMNVNWAKNQNMVNELYEDPQTGQKLEAYQITSSWGGVTIEARPGRPFGVIRANAPLRNENGDVVVGANGIALRTSAPIEVGNITPDWTGGIRNSFYYKGVNLSFLIDGRQGGDLFSVSDWFGGYAGLTEETAINGIRENGLVVKGVNESGEPNDVVISASSFFGSYWGREEYGIIDGSYIKFREFVIGYDIPKSIINKAGFIQGANVSFVGRNLAILYTHHSNDSGIDPETGFGVTNSGLGLEQFQLPTARTLGFKLNLTF